MAQAPTSPPQPASLQRRSLRGGARGTNWDLLGKCQATRGREVRSGPSLEVASPLLTGAQTHTHKYDLAALTRSPAVNSLRRTFFSFMRWSA